jgi:small GTP-binding protein
VETEANERSVHAIAGPDQERGARRPQLEWQDEPGGGVARRSGGDPRQGTIEKGSTALDRDPEEQARQQSISLAVASFDWNDHRINLIDTPGYADFRGEALLGMTVADLAVFVIDGVAGVQSQDEVLWRHAADMGLPRMIFVNKLDRERSSFDRTLAQVREVFGSHADPTELPIGEESSFHGVTDVLTHHAFVYDSGHAEPVDVPADLVETERAEHEHLVEDVIELDDELLEQYLSGTEPTPEQLEHLLHEAVDRGLAFPVLCGSATASIGADQLADFICRVGPAPGDRGPTLVERRRSDRRCRPRPRRSTARRRVQDDDRRVPRPDLDVQGPVRHDPRRRRARQHPLGHEGTAAQPRHAGRRFADPHRHGDRRRHRRRHQARRHPYR